MRATNLIPYSLLLILAGVFIAYIVKHDKTELYKQNARVFWREAYASGQLNQALKKVNDPKKQYTLDSLQMERRIREMFK